MLKKLLFTLCVIAVVVLVVVLANLLANPVSNVGNGAFLLPDETALLPPAIATSIRQIDRVQQAVTQLDAEGRAEVGLPPLNDQGSTTGAIYRRDAHAKAHGCVKASFNVENQLDPVYRYGVLVEGATYESWIRFSNGYPAPQPDKTWSARGMALKLTGVFGEKIEESDPPAETQDFVMVNNTPTFFIDEVKDYLPFALGLVEGRDLAYFFNDYSLNPLTWRLRQLALLARGTRRPPSSLLATQYFSWSPYKLGPSNIKYSAKPCEGTRALRVDRSDPKYLREELKAQLAAGDGCLDFMIQTQDPDAYMPIEDPTVEWSERDSPFVKVATIVIPQQDFDTEVQNEFCENLSFTPFHSLEAHRPIGGINRLRKAVYDEVSRYRHAMNDAPRAEPKGTGCLDLTDPVCASVAPPPETEQTDPPEAPPTEPR